MKRTVIILLTFFITVLSLGQDRDDLSKNYIPKNLQECFTQLDFLLSDSTKQKIITYSEPEFIGLSHLNLGMFLRNKWGLWRGLELSAYFNHFGIKHPESISSIILTSYYRYLTKKPIEFGSLINLIRAYENIAPLEVLNEDSLMFLPVKYEPFNKTRHQIIGELGSRNTDYNEFNKLLRSNNFPTISSPSFYAEVGYIGNLKQLVWSLKGTLYATQKEAAGDYEIVGENIGLEGGLGYALMRQRYLGIISYLDYGIVSYNYSLSNTTSFDFESSKNLKELDLNQISQYVSLGVGFYYNLVPHYNKIIGTRFNYNHGIGNNIYGKDLNALQTQSDINVQGIEIMLSLIIGLD
jgi:hypothetical protein